MANLVSVIGVGNTLMADDGVGVRVAEMLRDRLAEEPRVSVTTGGLAGMALMPAVKAADHVIFVDALAIEGAEPGDIFGFDPDEAGITKTRSYTSHGMGIPYLITSARMQGHDAEYRVFAVQIKDIMLGPDQLSPEVARAADEVVDLVEAHIREALGRSDQVAS